MGAGRETSSKEVDYWSWCAWVKTQKPLKGDLVVMVKGFKFGSAEHKSSETTEQDWEAI